MIKDIWVLIIVTFSFIFTSYLHSEQIDMQENWISYEPEFYVQNYVDALINSELNSPCFHYRVSKWKQDYENAKTEEEKILLFEEIVNIRRELNYCILNHGSDSCGELINKFTDNSLHY